MKPGSREYTTLRDWIAGGAPYTLETRSDVASVRVEPSQKIMGFQQTQPLRVLATFADGTERDVTWLAQFFSNDEATVRVSEGGLVKVLRYGETSVRAHFQGQVAVVNFTAPYENAVEPEVPWFRFTVLTLALFMVQVLPLCATSL